MLAAILRPAALVAMALVLMTVLRLLHLGELEEKSILFHQPTVDALEYYKEAHDRATGKFEYHVPIHGPLYPTLLGYAYGLCDGDPFWLRLLSSLSGQLTVLVLFLGGRLVIGGWPAAIGATLFALYRPGLLYECEFYAAGLANLAVTLTAAMLVGCSVNRRWWWVLGLGLCLGLASITRTNLLLLTPVAVLLLLLNKCSWQRTAAVVLLSLLPVGFVAISNHAASGEWIPIQARTGHNLYQANHPGSDGTVDIRPGPAFESFRRRPMVDSDAFGPGPESQFYHDRFWNFVTEHPGEFTSLLVLKAWNSLSPIEMAASYDNESNSQYSWLLRLPLPGFAWLLPLVLVGLLRPAANPRTHLMLLLVLVTVWISLVFGYAAGRYRFQAAGLTCFFAGAGLQALWRSLVVRGGGRRQTIVVLIALALGLLLNALTPRFVEQRLRWRAEYQHLQAYAYLTVGNLAAARERSEAAILLDPEAAWPYFTLGVVSTYGRDGQQGSAGADLDAAVAHYGEAIERLPDYPEAYQNRGWIHRKRGDTEAAVEDFVVLARLVPYRVQTWKDLAEAYRVLGQERKAQECQRRAALEEKRWLQRPRPR